MRTSESTGELLKALVAARAAFKPVLRDAIGQVGSDRSYRYADLSSVIDATMPALTANGLAVLQAIDAESASLVTRLAHVSGEWIEATYPLAISLPPQQFGSSLTYGRRYSLQSLLCLAAEDDDGAPAQPTPPPSKAKGKAISDAQRKRLFTIGTESGWSTAQMKAHLSRAYGVESSKDLVVRDYDQVCADFDQPPGAATEI